MAAAKIWSYASGLVTNAPSSTGLWRPWKSDEPVTTSPSELASSRICRRSSA